MTSMKERILEHLREPGYRPVKPFSLSRRLGITKKQMPGYREALDELVASGEVHQGRTGRVRLKVAPGLIAGTVKRISSGAGFLIPHKPLPELRGQDVHIAARDMGDAHTGDEVLVQLTSRRRSGGQRCGRIEQVLERARNQFVGTYVERDGGSFVRVDGKTFNEPIYVGDPGAKGARPDDKVVIEMLRFPSQTHPGEAVLTHVLGKRGRPGVDTLSVIHEFGLPDEFPDEVLEEARVEAENFDETDLSGRRDLTGDVIITIDPVDARDFDDAISLTRTDDGHWHLGVHIADVSHFVRPNTALDLEARKRGTSVYLPQRVLPMLPEVISNGLASLQQGKLRYARSCFIEFSAAGIPLHTEFSKSAIRVKKRFAYEQVMPLLEDPDNPPRGVSSDVMALLQRMHTLAMLLRKRRFKQGSLQMGLPEVRIDFNKRGEVIGAHEAHHDESHEIIEEFMLAANIAVATELADRRLAFLRRVHREPDERKLRAFAEFVSAIGFTLRRPQSRRDLQGLLDEVQDRPEAHAVNYAFLRSLKQAEYSPIDVGHYALSVNDYCHFTSPIRRYPDLTVHRLLDELSRAKPRTMSDVELLKLGRQCSLNERRAEKAERELTRLKLLSYMAGRIGEEFDAIITGVESFGFFCQGVEIPAEGLVHISSLSDDTYYFDPTSYTLSGHRRSNQFRLGDRVRVAVARVDLDRRDLDLRLIRAARQAGKRKPPRSEAGTRSRGKGRSKGRKGNGRTSKKAGRKSGRPGKRR